MGRRGFTFNLFKMFPRRFCFGKRTIRRTNFFYRHSNCVPKFHLNVDLISTLKTSKMPRGEGGSQIKESNETTRCSDPIWKDNSGGKKTKRATSTGNWRWFRMMDRWRGLGEKRFAWGEKKRDNNKNCAAVAFRPVIDCEPRAAANERHYTFYFYIRCCAQRRDRRKKGSSSRPSTLLLFYTRAISYSWILRGKLSTQRPTDRATLPPSTFRVLFLFIRGISTQPASQQNNQLFAPHLISPSPSHPLIGVGRSVLARLTGRSLPPCRSFGRSLLVLVSFVCTALDSSCLPASSTLLSLAPLPRWLRTLLQFSSGAVERKRGFLRESGAHSFLIKWNKNSNFFLRGEVEKKKTIQPFRCCVANPRSNRGWVVENVRFSIFEL